MSLLTLDTTDIVLREVDDTDFITTITPFQQGNLLTLAMHLLSLPSEYPDFEMRLFVNDERLGMRWHDVFRAECGTAACAVGHGPIAGVAYLKGEDWSDYSHRAFVPEAIDASVDEDEASRIDGEVWEWCFGSDWADRDNTAHGAAHRILWLLKKRSIPEDAEAQRRGLAAISYWPDVEPVTA